MNEVFNSTDKSKLKLYVTKVENLEAEKNQISEGIREVYKEMADEGFDVKTVRQVIKIRKMKEDSRKEAEELLELYKAALEML